ncbi:MAG: flavin oxidoreductase [Clostridiales bacterium]|nr:flavin oxidoreductase [Clostridiales bacterium]
MRKDLGVKPYILPMPVLIVSAYDENGNANAMNAAWGTICDMDKVLLVLTAGHKTTKNILSSKAFCVGTANKINLAESDYVGIVSGNKTKDKIKNTGWMLEKSKFVNAPVITSLPLSLECKLISYDTENEILIGEIVNVSADESIIEDDSVSIEKANPIVYDPTSHSYYTLGEKAGNAFSDGKKLIR